MMRILSIISGDYGQRHVDNIRAYGPRSWHVEVWRAPSVLPPVIDYPEDYLPDALPQSDLILSFAEHRGVAELLPDIVQMTGARAVVAAIDNEAWLPRGLARQLRGWLRDMGVACVTPKPLCSLTEMYYDQGRGRRVAYHDPYIVEFARHFGRPAFDIRVDPDTRAIAAIEVKRDAVCGCARYVAENLLGVEADDAEEAAGLLHHHFPCLASMGIDADYGDTLMHVSGNAMRDAVAEQVKPYKRTPTITPGNRVA
ncbi:MAG: hypothetical protein GXP42_18645 [Chloroflexi bacterium]|nr:hypothetical protein [Chloroflexota bacterium]